MATTRTLYHLGRERLALEIVQINFFPGPTTVWKAYRNFLPPPPICVIMVVNDDSAWHKCERHILFVKRDRQPMKNASNERIREILQSIQKIDYVDPGDIPNIDLYMDQVTTFMEQHLAASKRFEDDKILTKTMINNYTKNNLLPPPEKKKYSKEHMLLLTFIYYFKNFLSISDIQSILGPLSERFFGERQDITLEQIYDQVFNTQIHSINAQAKDLIDKWKNAQTTFSDVKNPEDKEFLDMFSFICMLCFDVWMKKNIIENIIDGNISSHYGKKQNTSPKKEDAKKEDAKNTKKEETKNAKKEAAKHTNKKE